MPRQPPKDPSAQAAKLPQSLGLGVAGPYRRFLLGLTGVTLAKEVLGLALAAEELAREVYRRAMVARPFRGPWATDLEAAPAQEGEHARCMREALGQKPALRFRLPEVFWSPIPLLHFLESLKEAFGAPT